MKQWQLQEAKAHLSKLVRDVELHGPQEITLRGEPAVVVLSKKEYLKLTQPKSSFLELMRNSPLVGLPIFTKRDKSKTRTVDL